MLFHNKKCIYKSKDKWLKPLFLAIKNFKDKGLSNCVLYDKVIGLAAAKLIVFGNFINEVNAHLLSKLAKDYLEQHEIKVNYDIITDYILNTTQEDMCPMEKSSLNKTPREFYNYLLELYKD